MGYDEARILGKQIFETIEFSYSEDVAEFVLSAFRIGIFVMSGPLAIVKPKDKQEADEARSYFQAFRSAEKKLVDKGQL